MGRGGVGRTFCLMWSGDQEKAAFQIISRGLGVPRDAGEHMDAQPNLLMETEGATDMACLDQLKVGSL